MIWIPSLSVHSSMCHPMFYTKIIPFDNNLCIFNQYGQMLVAKWTNWPFFSLVISAIGFHLFSQRILFSSICFQVRFLQARHTRRKLQSEWNQMNPKRCVCPCFGYCLSVLLNFSLSSSAMENMEGLASLLFTIFMESQTWLSQHSLHLKVAVCDS